MLIILSVSLGIELQQKKICSRIFSRKTEKIYTNFYTVSFAFVFVLCNCILGENEE